VGQQVPFENALGIYTRLLRLSDDEARVITTRALAILGEQSSDATDYSEAVLETAEPPASDTESSRSFLRNMRQRLRGRVKDDLRRWVELSAARTEVALLNTHVDNAVNFVELLEQEMASAEAVDMYLDALEVRESVAEVAYYLVLARIADEELPAVKRDAKDERGRSEAAAAVRLEGR
jgi:gamma-glutamylcysteine synthetase